MIKIWICLPFVKVMNFLYNMLPSGYWRMRDYNESLIKYPCLITWSGHESLYTDSLLSLEQKYISRWWVRLSCDVQLASKHFRVMKNSRANKCTHVPIIASKTWKTYLEVFPLPLWYATHFIIIYLVSWTVLCRSGGQGSYHKMQASSELAHGAVQKNCPDSWWAVFINEKAFCSGPLTLHCCLT